MGLMDKLGAERTPGYALTILRIAMGLSFLGSSWDKIRRESYAESMDFIFTVHWKDAAWGFYDPFIKDQVMNNLELFAFLVTYGELAIALAFISGALTRLAAGFAIFISLNIVFASGQSLFFPTDDWLFIYASLVIMIFAAGRYGGVDALLVEKFGMPVKWKKALY